MNTCKIQLYFYEISLESFKILQDFYKISLEYR